MGRQSSKVTPENAAQGDNQDHTWKLRKGRQTKVLAGNEEKVDNQCFSEN